MAHGLCTHRETHHTETILGFSLGSCRKEPLVTGVQYRPVSSRVRCAAPSAALELSQTSSVCNTCKDNEEEARQRSDFLPTPPLIGSWAYQKPVNERLTLTETCWRYLGGTDLSSASARGPSRGRMRSSCVLLTALVALAAYYIYIPLPSSMSDPWKLMLLDATFRSAQQVVRRSPELILSPSS